MSLVPGLALISYLTGRYDPADYSVFKDCRNIENGSVHYLLLEVAESYQTMKVAAGKAGYHLPLVSAFRSFDRQKAIWEAKWQGNHLSSEADRNDWSSLPPATRVQKILSYTAAPGCSRHHWGTDLDLCSVEPGYFNGSPGTEIQEWLKQNAAAFGFKEVYTEGRASGHQPEPWHYSYISISSILLNQFKESVMLQDLNDFSGSDLLPNDYFDVYMESVEHG